MVLTSRIGTFLSLFMKFPIQVIFLPLTPQLVYQGSFFGPVGHHIFDHCPLVVLRFDLNQFWNESNSNRSQYTYLFSSSSLVSSSGTDESPVIDRSNSFDLLFHTHFISLDPSTYYISLTPCTNYRVNNWQC